MLKMRTTWSLRVELLIEKIATVSARTKQDVESSMFEACLYPTESSYVINKDIMVGARHEWLYMAIKQLMLENGVDELEIRSN